MALSPAMARSLHAYGPGEDEQKGELRKRAMMWAQVRTHWRPLRGQMRDHWNKLSDADVDAIEGRRPKLIELLQQRYDLDEAEAMNQADAFVRSLQVLSL
jgi:uncharacterized protein YjbJ (UPF0337 family)